MAAIIDAEPTLDERMFGSLLSERLVSFNFGSLYEWLRHEHGWSYDVHSTGEYEPPLHPIWGLHIPLANRDQVDIVRSELFDRIDRAATDEKGMGAFIARRHAARTFELQTIDSVVSTAMGFASTTGHIVTERETDEVYERLEDRSYTRRIFEKLFGPASIGEFLAVPNKA